MPPGHYATRRSGASSVQLPAPVGKEQGRFGAKALFHSREGSPRLSFGLVYRLRPTLLQHLGVLHTERL
eukprot:1263573-Amphidinium_carterae.1